ncbi:MAG: alpha/beta hydrolase family protein [bacterium]
MTSERGAEVPYGLWRSPFDPAELLAQTAAPMHPFRHRGRLHWLQAAPGDGRVVLMRASESGGECMTPAQFNLRSGVHEYGGKCFCVLGDEVVFNNLADGRIYRQSLCDASAPRAVTAANVATADAPTAFADLTPLARANAVIAVMESGAGADARDCLAWIDLSSSRAPTIPIPLAEGADFYACPAASPDERELAWMEWDDPFMPWDQSRLCIAELHRCGKSPRLRARRALVDRAERAVCQIGFLADGGLLFASDGDGCDFWNLFHYRGDAVRQVTDDALEYGEAHWTFGQCRWREVAADQVVAVASAHAGDRLVHVDLASGATTPLAEGFAACAHLFADAAHADAAASELLFIAHHAERGAQVRALDLTRVDADDSQHANADDSHRTTTRIASRIATRPSRALHSAAPQTGADDCSRPQPIAYPTRDGARAYAYLYAPRNRRQRAPRGDKPPLLVVVHVGPTSRATPQWHPLKQYFASLGYAVLDINHRGSTGYGRAYRQRLLGRWGEIDADDIADGVRYALDHELADPELVFIRGGSAGGYAVLRALTRFPRMFCAGACYYGIGNLITLAQITHRFEGRYTDRLIGEDFDADADLANRADSRFVSRSPIFQMESLRSPLILLQGRDDKVVPPEVSREVAQCLEQKGIQYEYVEYENEGHGFRRARTRLDALSREIAFFSRIIRAKREADGA